MRGQSPIGRARGFTLLELILVLAIVAGLYAVAGLRIGAGQSGLEAKSAVRQIAAGLRKARSLAITEQREATLSIDVEARRFSVGDDRQFALPRELEYRIFTATKEQVTAKTAAIRFYPDGSSTGGRITVLAGERQQWLDIDWLTGKLSFGAPE